MEGSPFGHDNHIEPVSVSDWDGARSEPHHSHGLLTVLTPTGVRDKVKTSTAKSLLLLNTNARSPEKTGRDTSGQSTAVAMDTLIHLPKIQTASQ